MSFGNGTYEGRMRHKAGVEKRARELLGNDYDRLFMKPPQTIPWEPIAEVGELLIEDAIKTGKWKELPNELQDEYHRRVGGSEENVSFGIDDIGC